MMLRVFTVCFLLLLCLGCMAQEAVYDLSPVDDVIAKLTQASSTDPGEWQFQLPAEPGGEAVELDDAGWESVRPEHTWSGDNTEAWYRLVVNIPETISGFPVKGSRVVLRVSADDDGDIYVNGKLANSFHWDQGVVNLTDSAQAGDEYVVAVKVKNIGGPGRLLTASITYDAFGDLRPMVDQHRQRLDFCRYLVNAKRAEPNKNELSEVLIAAVKKVDFEAAGRRDMQAFKESIAASLEALQPFSKLAKEYTLWLAGHAHIDMNWLWLWPETKDVCRASWNQALKFGEEFPEFRFGQSQPGAYIAIEKENPEILAQIKTAVERGMWEPLGASWVEGDTNMASGEALARHCLLTYNYYMERFGVASNTGWYPDNFGHAWTVPSIFADAGIENYYFCRCGKGIPMFWWEGPDGARLAAYNFAGWYSEQMRRDSGRYPVEMDNQLDITDAMLVYGVGDHGGGPTRQDIETAIQLKDDPIFPNVKFSTTREYFAAALEKSEGKLPVIRDELNTVFEGCYTSHADIKKWNRESENLLPTAEALAVIAGQWDYTYPTEELKTAWQNTLFNQFHDIFDGTAIHGSYEYSYELYDAAKMTAQRTIDDALNVIARQANTLGDGQAVMVWNPVAWERMTLVECQLPTGNRWENATVQGPDGVSYVAQVMASEATDDGWQTTIVFNADLPALGFSVYHVTQADATVDEEKPTLGDAAFNELNSALATGIQADSFESMKLDLASLFNDNTLPTVNLGLQILQENSVGMSAWNIGQIIGMEYLRLTGSKVVADGPVCKQLLLNFEWGSSTFNLLLTIPNSNKQAITGQLNVNWQEVGGVAAGSPFLKLALHTGYKDPQVTFEIPWGAIERDQSGAEVPGQKWVDLTETVSTEPQAGRQPRAIDVSTYFNEDVISPEVTPMDGDFDNGKRAYPVSIFGENPRALLAVNDLSFFTPPVADGKLNSIRCDGQTIDLALQVAGSLAVLGAGSNGQQTGLATLVYADGTEQTVSLGMGDWCNGPRGAEKSVFTSSFRIIEGLSAPTVCNIYAQQILLDETRAIKSIRLPVNRNMHVFGLAFAEKITRTPTSGIALLNDCKYGFDVKNGTLRMSLIRASYDPDPLPDQGLHQIGFALVPHVGDWRTGDVPRRAYEFNNQPIVRLVESHPGELAAKQPFLKVGPDNFILAALKQAEDGEGIIARVYNSTGVGGTAQMSLTMPFAKATAVNLLEQPREAKNLTTVTDRNLNLDLQGRLHGTVRIE